jgi:hypothetical protein
MFSVTALAHEYLTLEVLIVHPKIPDVNRLHVGVYLIVTVETLNVIDVVLTLLLSQAILNFV